MFLRTFVLSKNHLQGIISSVSTVPITLQTPFLVMIFAHIYWSSHTTPHKRQHFQCTIKIFQLLMFFFIIFILFIL